MKVNRKQRVCLTALKYIPIFTASTMLLHVLFLLLGRDYSLAETITGCSLIPTLLLLAMSVAFKFCWLHKAFILYTLLVDSCIEYQRFVGFENYLFPARIFVFLIGLSLFTYLFIHLKKFNQNCYDKQNN